MLKRLLLWYTWETDEYFAFLFDNEGLRQLQDCFSTNEEDLCGQNVLYSCSLLQCECSVSARLLWCIYTAWDQDTYVHTYVFVIQFVCTCVRNSVLICPLMLTVLPPDVQYLMDSIFISHLYFMMSCFSRGCFSCDKVADMLAGDLLAARSFLSRRSSIFALTASICLCFSLSSLCMSAWQSWSVGGLTMKVCPYTYACTYVRTCIRVCEHRRCCKLLYSMHIHICTCTYMYVHVLYALYKYVHVNSYACTYVLYL